MWPQTELHYVSVCLHYEHLTRTHTPVCVTLGPPHVAQCAWRSVRVYLWWFTLVFMPLTNCNSCPRCFENPMFITENDCNWLIYTSAKYHGKLLNRGAVEQTTVTWWSHSPSQTLCIDSLFILLTGVSSPLRSLFPLLINDPIQFSLLVVSNGFWAHVAHTVREKSLHAHALNWG